MTRKISPKFFFIVFIFIIILVISCSYFSVYKEKSVISVLKVYVEDREIYLFAVPKFMNNSQFYHLENQVNMVLTSTREQNPMFLFVENRSTSSNQSCNFRLSNSIESHATFRSSVKYSYTKEILEGLYDEKCKTRTPRDLLLYSLAQPLSYMTLILNNTSDLASLENGGNYNSVSYQDIDNEDLEHTIYSNQISENLKLLLDGSSLYFAIVEKDYLFGRQGVIANLESAGFNVEEIRNGDIDYSPKFLYKPKILTE